MHPVEQGPKERGAAYSDENSRNEDSAAMTPIAPAHSWQQVIPVIALASARS